MEVNLLVQTDFSLDTQQEELLKKVTTKIETTLQIDANYVLSVIFVDAKEIHRINKEYRQIDRPTDVISFALLDNDEGFVVSEEVELGDIFINVEAITTQANEYGHSFERELAFLFTHGVLHLLGYDHMQEEEEAVMFTLQDRILNEIITR